MLSAVVDALGARDGYVLEDRLTNGGLDGPWVQRCSVLRSGSPEEVAGEFRRRAAALGYTPEPPERRLIDSARGDSGWRRFEVCHSLPSLEYRIAGSGDEVDGVTVPSSASVLQVHLSPRFTVVENGRSIGHPNSGTLRRMAEHHLKVTPVPTWKRYWGGWWQDRAVAVALVWRGHLLGAYRGKVVEVRRIGGEAAVGPCELSVLTIRRGSSEDALRRLATRATRHGYRLASVGGIASKGRTAHLVVFQAGEVIDRHGSRVPPGRTGIAVALTHRGTRTGTRPDTEF